MVGCSCKETRRRRKRRDEPRRIGSLMAGPKPLFSLPPPSVWRNTHEVCAKCELGKGCKYRKLQDGLHYASAPREAKETQNGQANGEGSLAERHPRHSPWSPRSPSVHKDHGPGSLDKLELPRPAVEHRRSSIQCYTEKPNHRAPERDQCLSRYGRALPACVPAPEECTRHAEQVRRTTGPWGVCRICESRRLLQVGLLLAILNTYSSSHACTGR